MSREDLVAIASRLFAVFLLVTVARSVPSAAALLDHAGERPSLVAVALVLASSFFVCGVLWFFPLSVARRFLPVMKEARSENIISSSAALPVGLTLLGMWVLATAISDAIYWGTLFLTTRNMDIGPYLWGHEQIAGVVSTAVELALAAVLIFGSSGISRIIERWRYGSSQRAA